MSIKIKNYFYTFPSRTSSFCKDLGHNLISVEIFPDFQGVKRVILFLDVTGESCGDMGISLNYD